MQIANITEFGWENVDNKVLPISNTNLEWPEKMLKTVRAVSAKVDAPITVVVWRKMYLVLLDVSVKVNAKQSCQLNLQMKTSVLPMRTILQGQIN